MKEFVLDYFGDWEYVNLSCGMKWRFEEMEK
jgi:hypothetical protein